MHSNCACPQRGKWGPHKEYDFQISKQNQHPDYSPTGNEAVQEGTLSEAPKIGIFSQFLIYSESLSLILIYHFLITPMDASASPHSPNHNFFIWVHSLQHFIILYSVPPPAPQHPASSLYPFVSAELVVTLPSTPRESLARCILFESILSLKKKNGESTHWLALEDSSFFLRFINFYLMCMGVSPACLSVQHLRVWSQQRSEERDGSPRTEITDGFWKSNSGPLWE